MDIPLVGGQGVSFLSKVEVRKWPIIGWLGSQGGTVFIDRGKKSPLGIQDRREVRLQYEQSDARWHRIGSVRKRPPPQ